MAIPAVCDYTCSVWLYLQCVAIPAVCGYTCSAGLYLQCVAIPTIPAECGYTCSVWLYLQYGEQLPPIVDVCWTLVVKQKPAGETAHHSCVPYSAPMPPSLCSPSLSPPSPTLLSCTLLPPSLIPSSLEQGVVNLLVHDHGLKHGSLSDHKLNHPVNQP